MIFQKNSFIVIFSFRRQLYIFYQPSLDKYNSCLCRNITGIFSTLKIARTCFCCPISLITMWKHRFFFGGGASIFLCWKCTYAGYVYPVADSFKFSREDETRLLTKAEYAQSMIPYGRLVYGQLSEEFCLLRRFHCRMAENCIGKLRGSTRVLTIRHLDEGAADVLPCKEKLSWEFTKSCCMHSNWFCWNGGFPWDLQWTSINGPRSSCKREVESLKRGVCYFASRCSHWK